jgi:predicted porin
MKKSLLAVAAIGAFASAAQAQSSVTVYGILDTGFQGVTARENNIKSNATKFSGEGAETTSRLGFKGTEDLGGGTSAFFTIELGLNTTDVSVSGDKNTGMLNRQSFVGLSKKGIGSVALGTQYTPVHLAVSRTDPGQQNNMLGNVIYATSGAQGNGQTTTAYTVRYNNALTLQTERMAGFQAYGIYNNSNSNKNDPATSQTVSNNEAYGLGVNYVWNKLNVDAAFNASKQQSLDAKGNVTPALPLLTNTIGTVVNPLGVSIGILSQYAGVTYDFGILKAYAQYINTKYTANTSSNTYVSRAGQQIGVRSFVTPTVEAWASAGNGNINAGASNAGLNTNHAKQNFTCYQIGSNYWLSKRTNMYAIFGSTQVSSSSLAVSEGGSSYGVGVRHTF